MGQYYKIALVGAGNVAWHLGQTLENAGHSVLEVYSRNIRNAEKLCARLYEANATESLFFENSEIDIFIIAVSDRAIEEVARQITIPRSSVIVHTSGMTSQESLKFIPNPYGVFYPVQTFSKGRQVNFKEIPISIQASDKGTVQILKSLAESISRKVYFHTTEERRMVHLASVFASNFTNHMLTISKGLLESNDLSFDIIKPLIKEVVNKAFEIDPENAQTGPAVRQDFNTMERHLDYLTQEPGLTKIYKAISDDIIKTYQED